MAPLAYDLATLDGRNGFVINHTTPNTSFSLSVSGGRDINNDGIDDVFVSTPLTSGTLPSVGSTYVIFGSSGTFPQSLNTSELQGNQGSVINSGISYEFSGDDISGLVDINGDGIDDLIIGASAASPQGNLRAGKGYVVFGQSGGLGNTFDLLTLNGSNGFVINGVFSEDFLGASVSSGGDLNNDGMNDLIIGAPFASPNGQVSAGKTYIIFGKTTGWFAEYNLQNLNGSNGFVFNGFSPNEFSGSRVSDLGDVNGDGRDDLIIGAPNADPNGQKSAGRSYVIFGRDRVGSQELNVEDLNGSNGFIIEGSIPKENVGTSVTGADLNGDGIRDIIIGAPYASTPEHMNAGQVYVIWGKRTPFSRIINTNSLDGSNGLTIQGRKTGDQAGFSVAGVPDINGDGISDLLIGANTASPDGKALAGEVYGVFGHTGIWPRILKVEDLDRYTGLVFYGVEPGEQTGYSVSKAGDINRDNYNDIVIGAPFASYQNQVKTGKSYVVFGGNAFSGFAGTVLTGTPNNDSLTGTEGTDTITGLMGSDTLIGLGNHDRLLGNEDHDSIWGGSGADSVWGGAGFDSVYGGKDDDFLSGDNQDDFLWGNMGNDRLNGGSGNDSLYGGKNNDTLQGEKGNDWLEGGQGFDVLVGGNGSDNFVLSPNSGLDTILDFVPGQDRLVLSGGISSNQVDLIGVNGGTSIRFSSTGEVIAFLVGVNPVPQILNIS